MKSLALKLPEVLKRYSAAAKGTDCAIYRVSQLESYLAYIFRGDRQPFFLEVVNDPETFVHMPDLLRRANKFMLRLLLHRANGAAFVTERILQEKYLPPRRRQDANFTISHYSSIELKPSWMAAPRKFNALAQIRMAHVSNSIDNDIKGHRTAIAVVARLRDREINASLTCIGDGSAVAELKALCDEWNVRDRVNFIGRIHDRALLLAELRDSDLFLYPTRLEGLPRAVIEAMAVGLPTLSTPIAGIPELLEPRYMFDPDDVEGFADAIARLKDEPEELSRMSRQNIETSRKYAKDVLDARRSDFYARLRALARPNAV